MWVHPLSRRGRRVPCIKHQSAHSLHNNYSPPHAQHNDSCRYVQNGIWAPSYPTGTNVAPISHHAPDIDAMSIEERINYHPRRSLCPMNRSLRRHRHPDGSSTLPSDTSSIPAVSVTASSRSAVSAMSTPSPNALFGRVRVCTVSPPLLHCLAGIIFCMVLFQVLNSQYSISNVNSQLCFWFVWIHNLNVFVVWIYNIIFQECEFTTLFSICVNSQLECFCDVNLQLYYRRMWIYNFIFENVDSQLECCVMWIYNFIFQNVNSQLCYQTLTPKVLTMPCVCLSFLSSFLSPHALLNHCNYFHAITSFEKTTPTLLFECTQ